MKKVFGTDMRSENPMRIFFLGESMHPNAETWIKGLKEYGHAEVETWQLKQRQGPLARILRIKDWFWACLFLKYRIRKFKPDILLGYRVTSYGFIGACADVHPYVVAQQGVTDVWPPHSFSTPFKAILGRYALKKADMIHAWGKVMVPAMIGLDADTGKIRVMPRGVDTSSYVYKPEDKRWDRIIAVVTRSLAPDYRHEVILKALKILKDKNIPIEVYMIGDGPLRKNLENMSMQLELQDIVHWEGRIPNEELSAYLKKANMYISMPISEGVSASLLEAMAAGCFPIVTDLPSNREFITHGENGYLVEVDNAAALAVYIQKAWEHKGLMKHAFEENREEVEHHASYQKNLPEFVNMYRGLIADYKNKKTPRS
jgi:glycosyltransferase involved in cell wall biosynthesis